jgi:hypothetical protein
VTLVRRVGRRERAYGFTLLAAAGPFEGCGGRRRLFVVSAAAPTLPIEHRLRVSSR